MPIRETHLEECPARLDANHVTRFRREGYLAFAGVLNPSELDAAREALSGLTRRLSEGSADEVEFSPPRRESGNHSGASYRFKGRGCFMQLEPGFDPAGRPSKEIEPMVRKYMSFVGEDAALLRIVGAGGSVRNVVDGLIGADPILFQEMALVKPPFIGSEKPWHQDNAYFSVAPLDAIVGVWIALDDAGIENGCMHVIPGGHDAGALRHIHGSDCQIVEGRLDVSRAVPVPVPAGGAMFFYGLLPHETPANRSPRRRRALQFHYRSAASRVVDAETYNGVFVEADGTPASCRAASVRQGSLS